MRKGRSVLKASSGKFQRQGGLTRQTLLGVGLCHGNPQAQWVVVWFLDLVAQVGHHLVVGDRSTHAPVTHLGLGDKVKRAPMEATGELLILPMDQR